MASLLPVSYRDSKIYYSLSDKSCGITKMFLMFVNSLIAIVVLIFSLNMIMVPLGPKPPIIQLNSLSLSNFTISKTKLAAIWDANFTVYNPNLALNIYLDNIETSIFYKQDNALSITSVEGFQLGLREKRNVYMKFATTGYEGDQPIVEYPVLKEIKNDSKRGNVHFSMKISAIATYKVGLIGWTRGVTVNPYCLHLNVGVVAALGNGSLIRDGPKDCPVLMMLTDAYRLNCIFPFFNGFLCRYKLV